MKNFKNKISYKNGKDQLIKNYGIGAQIIKSLHIKNMILVTRSRKKVVGLEGYGIRITKQEIIKCTINNCIELSLIILISNTPIIPNMRAPRSKIINVK